MQVQYRDEMANNSDPEPCDDGTHHSGKGGVTRMSKTKRSWPKNVRECAFAGPADFYGDRNSFIAEDIVIENSRVVRGGSSNKINFPGKKTARDR